METEGSHILFSGGIEGEGCAIDVELFYIGFNLALMFGLSKGMVRTNIRVLLYGLAPSIFSSSIDAASPF